MMENLKNFCNTIINQMDERLMEVRLEFPRADHWSKESVPIIKSALDELKSYILKNPFRKRSEEVFFFKEVKCAVMGKLLYNVWVHNIEANRPSDSMETEAYFSEELELIYDFYERHTEIHDYFRSNLTVADNKFFLRKVDDPFTFKDMPQFVDGAFFHGDPEFSTPMDYLFAQFRGYLLLEDYLTNELETLDLMGSDIYEEELEFTGNRADFVQMVLLFRDMVRPRNEAGELLTEQQIAESLADMFHYDLGDADDFETLKLIAGNSDYTENMQKTLERLRAKWDEEDGDKEYGNDDRS